MKTRPFVNSNLVEGDITVASSFTVQYKNIAKRNGIVFLHYKGTAVPPAVAGWQVIGTIVNPSGIEMRPKDDFDIHVPDNNSSPTNGILASQIRIYANGNIAVYFPNITKNQIPLIHVAYI